MPKDKPYAFEDKGDFRKRMKKKKGGKFSAADQAKALRRDGEKGGKMKAPEYGG